MLTFCTCILQTEYTNIIWNSVYHGIVVPSIICFYKSCYLLGWKNILVTITIVYYKFIMWSTEETNINWEHVHLLDNSANCLPDHMKHVETVLLVHYSTPVILCIQKSSVLSVTLQFRSNKFVIHKNLYNYMYFIYIRITVHIHLKMIILTSWTILQISYAQLVGPDWLHHALSQLT